MDIHSIIIQPVITEKSMGEASNFKYTFVVANHANKDDIKRAVENKFNVHVEGVSTVIVKGKSIRTGAKRIEKKISSKKKAIVKVKNGEKIALFEIKE